MGREIQGLCGDLKRRWIAAAPGTNPTCHKIDWLKGLKPSDMESEAKMLYRVWSIAFLQEDGAVQAEKGICFVHMSVWTRITEDLEGEGRGRIFAATSAKKQWMCALGQPLAQPVPPEHENGVFFPFWMLEQMGLEGTGEEVEINWFSEEALPEATRILLRPHDSAFYHSDAKEELETALTRLGVVHQGTTVQLSLGALGGYEVAFDVVATEPADIVLAHGEEVAIEFEEALDAVAAAPVATVATAASPIPCPEFDPILPEPQASAKAGAALGGGPVRRMPDGRAWNPWRQKV